MAIILLISSSILIGFYFGTKIAKEELSNEYQVKQQQLQESYNQARMNLAQEFEQAKQELTKRPISSPIGFKPSNIR